MFRGLQKISLIDFPGQIAATVFTAGCNFRCPWCHNPDLVYPGFYDKIPPIEEEDVGTYLLSKKGKIQGVCVTGGEPTVWGERLSAFLKWCIKNGFLTKLDTNGYLPDVLKSYLKEGVLSFVAMDIKNTFGKYGKTVGLDSVDIEKIKESIGLIRKSGIDHRFRTTMVHGLVDRGEMEALSREIGEEILFQEYRTSVPAKNV
jgi:pyruvate formate lyase activating enzyme